MTGALPLPRTSSAARLAPFTFLAIAALPVVFIALQAIAASRNIVFWDEFDTALDFIIRLSSGADLNEVLHRFFAVNNEHRMFTSRLLFATSYWLTGTVNFHIVGAIGNLFIVGACAILIASTASLPRRVSLGVILSFLIFQLESFENFLWSGASIDHFQVVMLAVAALAAVARGSRTGVLGGGLLAFLATFTLAHGCVTWLVGALLLANQRRWQHLAIWVGLAAAVMAAFINGFQINPNHRIDDFSVVGLGHLGHYWLALLGGPLTFGDINLAPAVGMVLIVGVGVLGASGAFSRQPVLFSAALFAIGALGLVALGRAEVSGGQILSRYMVLGSLAWAIVIFLVLQHFTPTDRPYHLLAWCLPALVVFNLAANAKFSELAEGYAEARDRAALRYKQYGDVDGHGQVQLHPQSGHAQKLLGLARNLGVYELPDLCEPAEFSNAAPSARIISYLDEKTISRKAVYLGGWAMLPDTVSRRGQVHVVLRSKTKQLFFTTVTLQRPDVAKAYNEPRWRLSGFRFVASRDRLPVDDFQIGLLIENGRKSEFVMTDQWLRLTNPDSNEPWLANDS
jgi:hypothetical protein